jgi:hypothetical protein
MQVKVSRHSPTSCTPCLTRLRDEIFRQSLLINLSRHGLDRLGHYWSFPPSNLGVSGPVTPKIRRPGRA